LSLGYRDMDKTPTKIYMASSFAHYKSGTDLLEVMSWVRDMDILCFGKYAPKSRAKRRKVRDYQIKMTVEYRTNTLFDEGEITHIDYVNY
jgi:hypothetical protein